MRKAWPARPTVGKLHAASGDVANFFVLLVKMGQGRRSRSWYHLHEFRVKWRGKLTGGAAAVSLLRVVGQQLNMEGSL